jgi:hypothetical protein
VCYNSFQKKVPDQAQQRRWEKMSQKKVDAYKEKKANREKILKREKRMLLLEKFIGVLICIVAVCWVGFSVYQKVADTQTATTTVQETSIDTNALDDYLSSLSADEAE